MNTRTNHRTKHRPHKGTRHDPTPMNETFPEDGTMMLRTSTPRSPRRAASLLALAAVVVLAACGTLNMGGLSETRVTVSGDAPDPVAAARVAPPLARQTDDDDDDDDDEAEGELDADFYLYLLDAAGEPVELSPDQLEVRVDVQGTTEQEAVTVSVPAQRYTGLRVVFVNIDVEIDAGLIINGQEVLGEVDVELEADSLTVDRPLSLDLEDGEAVELLVDLNAQSWLLAVDPTSQVVPGQAFAEVIDVRVVGR